MSQPFRLTLQNQRTGEAEFVTGEINSSDWNYLVSFLEEVESLGRTRLMAQQGNVNYAFNWTREVGMTHKATLPDEDDVSAFLHRLRPFVLQREPFFLPKVVNCLRRAIRSPHLDRVLDRQTEVFFGRDITGITIATDSLTLTSDDAVMKWLNAIEYHRDERKRKELSSIEDAIPRESQRAIFLIALIDKARSVVRIARIVEMIRDRGGVSAVLESKRG